MKDAPASGESSRRRIKARIPRAAVNRTMLMATSFGVLAAATWPGINGDGALICISGLSAIMTLAAVNRAWKTLRRDFQLRDGVAVAERPGCCRQRDQRRRRHRR